VEAAGSARTVDTAGGATAGATDDAALCSTGAAEVTGATVAAGTVAAGAVVWLLAATVVVGAGTVVAGAVVVTTAAESRMDHAMALSFIMQHGSDCHPTPMHCAVVGHERLEKYVLPVPDVDGSSVHVVPLSRITSDAELPAATALLPTSRQSVADTHVIAAADTALGVFGMDVAMTGIVMFVQRVSGAPEPRS